MPAPAQSTIEFPCQTLAMVETPVYARADGYIKARPVDIGDRVKKGDLLFEIETPELDQQMQSGAGHAGAIESGVDAVSARAWAPRKAI